ncbi:MAG: TspO/MBR family protein [Pseudomonadota bacterium]
MSLSFNPVLVLSIVVAVVVGFLGGALTQIGPWYEGLTKPSWNPPNWLFPPVWTTIYALIVTAVVRTWPSLETTDARLIFMALFAVNILLNVAWSGLFFTLQRPDWSFVELLALWLSILALVLFMGAQDRVAGFLMLPYLVWVAFAGWLNFVIVRLNAPFGT